MSFILEIENLRKTYKNAKKHALDNINLRVKRGSCVGLLGPNGAGKSTFINILSGLIFKDSGTVIVDGFNIDEEPRNYKTRIGVVPQELTFDAFLTPYKTLEYISGLYGIPPEDRFSQQLLRELSLADHMHARSASLSGGMKRRLMIAKALSHSPPIVILDEPTAGVDILLREQLWGMIRRLQENGTTILLTTHYLEEAHKLCDEIVIINNGRVLVQESTQKLVAQFDHKKMILVTQQELVEQDIENLKEICQTVTVLPHNAQDHEGYVTHLTYTPHCIHDGKILEYLVSQGYEILSISSVESTLEDVFHSYITRKN